MGCRPRICISQIASGGYWRNGAMLIRIPRVAEIVTELVFFRRRIRLSQWSLEMIYGAIVCFVVTSLLLANERPACATVLPGQR